ncbi:phosphotransferase [Maribius pontilimi]|uniref:Phosphotransferase n=1 Tax=Palleronia pontilimi TaxID=1964209 RepID=A0A934IDK4_9RHOB|nr:phosphotransferase [Palleronia pontilimi]MBJ3761530.1 phosphotransferase [Palleronia pontilimi]
MPKDPTPEPVAARVAAAMTVLPTLARQAGLDADGWTPTVLRSRKTDWTDGIVMRLSRGPASVILKHDAHPGRIASFRDEIDAARAAQAALPDDPEFRVPRILALHDGEAAVLLEDAQAEPMAAMLEGLPEADHLPLLQRAGAWLDRLHRARLGERRTFRPQATTKHLEGLVSRIERGEAVAVAQPDFLAAAQACLSQRARFAGLETIAAIPHGDFHLRNLLIGNAAWGIDFLPKQVQAVGQDIARFLVHYATFFAPFEDIRPGEVIPDRALQAFFRGYTLVGPEDPGVQFLMRHRILADWWRLSPDAETLNEIEAARLFGLRRLARIVFD